MNIHFVDATWASVRGYEGLYEVSSIGQVRSIDRYIPLSNGKTRFVVGRTLVPQMNNYEYHFVKLSKGGSVNTHYIHRLVAKAFIPNPDNLPQVNHLSGNKEDNSINNLEWCTASQNAQHAYDTGINTHKGGLHTFSVGVVDNISGQEFATIKEFCEHYGINYSSGRNYLSGYNKKLPLIDLSAYSFQKLRKRGKHDI